MKLLGCVCIPEGLPEGWKDLRLEYPGAQPASDSGISKLQKLAGNWSSDEEDMRNLGLNTESKGNKRKHNTLVQRNIIPK